MFSTREQAHHLAEMIQAVHPEGARGQRLGSVATLPIATLKQSFSAAGIPEMRGTKGAQCRAHHLVEMIQVVHPGGARGTRLGSVATSPIATLKQFFSAAGIPDTQDAKTLWARAHGHSARSYGVRTNKSRDEEPMCS
jgi:hypothetical protein